MGAKMVLTSPRAWNTLRFTMLKRIYESLLREHQREQRQMAFVVGPRQVGKTTSCRNSVRGARYYTWDNQADRLLVSRGPDAVAADLQLDRLRAAPVSVIFDEIHKYSKWKTFLKGFFDVYGAKTKIIVTGSSRLDVYKKGGDSLMGRYFLYRMNPLSVGELLRTGLSEKEIRPPRKLDKKAFDGLLRFGGFPEPFLKRNARFVNRWKRMRRQQLFREDLRDLTQVKELGQIEILADLLGHQCGQQVNLSSLARAVNVSVDTTRRWLATLESLYYCFTVRPWHRNVPKSLRKQPKVYLRDWSVISDVGARLESFVAVHLLKAVEWWEDIGLGEYKLFYLRDKQKREVDFLVTRNGVPWFLAEVKASGSRPLSPALRYFQKRTNAPHAFQVVFDLGYVNADCFAGHDPTIVPARTFLSQLV